MRSSPLDDTMMNSPIQEDIALLFPPTQSSYADHVPPPPLQQPSAIRIACENGTLRILFEDLVFVELLEDELPQPINREKIRK